MTSAAKRMGGNVGGSGGVRGSKGRRRFASENRWEGDTLAAGEEAMAWAEKAMCDIVGQTATA